MSGVKIEPCAWCGKAPSNSRFIYSVDHWCDLQYVDAMESQDWNRRQSVILARRRADFEAALAVYENTDVPLYEDFDAYLSRKGDA